jgi:ubiquinone/menaquinone biosynthesis C-methylase UbiE
MSADSPSPPVESPERGLIDRVSFDEQAHSFEARAGLPDGVPQRVAEAVREYAGLGRADLLVEIGAGTGLIGQWLARQPVRYLGMDSSQPMLDVFAPRLPGGDAQLRHADANQRWPVEDGVAHAIFGSRVFQLLDIDHLVREADRVGAPERTILIQGRLTISRDSPKTAARAKLRELLAAHGLRTRPAERLLRRVLERAVEQGGTLLPPYPVATWQRGYGAAEVLGDWSQKWSMGGITPPPEIKQEVMAQLAAWAEETYGDPTRPVTTEERYVLEGVRLHPKQSAAPEQS